MFFRWSRGAIGPEGLHLRENPLFLRQRISLRCFIDIILHLNAIAGPMQIFPIFFSKIRFSMMKYDWKVFDVKEACLWSRGIRWISHSVCFWTFFHEADSFKFGTTPPFTHSNKLSTNAHKGEDLLARFVPIAKVSGAKMRLLKRLVIHGVLMWMT